MKTSEEKRAVFLPAAKLLFTAAHMQGILKDIQGAATELEIHNAYQAAININGMYENLYNDEGRYYHTLQHPRIQLLDTEGLKLLGKIYDATIAPEQEEEYVTKLAQNLSAELAQTLRDQDRHDCIYYLPSSSGQQHNWLHRFKTETLTVSDIMEESRQYVAEDPIHFAEPMPYPDSQVSIGELSAIALFPDNNGGYNTEKTFVKQGGLNEWASAVYAITHENRLRVNQALPPINAEEILQICTTMAATLPFQNNDKLDNIANNLYLFLSKPEQAPLRNALGVEGDALKQLIDKSVYNAGKLANRDVGNFATTTLSDLYYGDRTVTAENTGINPATTDPIQQFKLSYLIIDQHAEETVRNALDPTKTGDGFIRAMGVNEKIYHDFNASLSGLSQYRIEEEADKHTQYQDNITPLLEMHKRDMAFYGVSIINSLSHEPSSLPRKEELSPALIDAFFHSATPMARTLVNLTKEGNEVGVEGIGKYRLKFFSEQIKRNVSPSLAATPDFSSL